MITLTYTKVILFKRKKSNRTQALIQRWSAIEVIHLPDHITIITYLTLSSDTRKLYDGVWLDGITNPLTKIRNEDRIRHGID